PHITGSTPFRHRGATAGVFEGLFRQHFFVGPFARRDRIFRIDTDILPAACVNSDPTSCAQRLAFAGKQKTRVVHDALNCESTSHATKFSRTVTTGSVSKR